MPHSLVGHDDILRSFQNRLKEGTLSHAYLFFGPAQIGKTTLLRTLAQMLLRADLEKPLHPDLFFLDGEEQERIPIETVRDMERFAGFLPSMGGIKVLALAHIDRLTREAANALLKLFEDPPARTILLATTHAPGRIPLTLRSRMERIRCARVPETFMQKRWGKDLCRFAEGKPGKAVRAEEESELIVRLEKEEHAWATFFREPAKHLQTVMHAGSDRETLQPLLISAQRVLHDLLRSQLRENTDDHGRTRTLLRAILRTRRILEQTNASPKLAFEEFLFTCL